MNFSGKMYCKSCHKEFEWNVYHQDPMPRDYIDGRMRVHVTDFPKDPQFCYEGRDNTRHYFSGHCPYCDELNQLSAEDAADAFAALGL